MKTITFPAKSFIQFVISSFKSLRTVKKLLKEGKKEITVEYTWTVPSEIIITYEE